MFLPNRYCVKIDFNEVFYGGPQAFTLLNLFQYSGCQLLQLSLVDFAHLLSNWIVVITLVITRSKWVLRTCDYELLFILTCKCFTAPIIIAKIHCKAGILPTSFSKPKTIPSTSTPKFAEVDAIYSWPRPCLQVCSCFFVGHHKTTFPSFLFQNCWKE